MLIPVLCTLNAFAANSTLVGQSDWIDYGNVNSTPPVDFIIGTWTHVYPPVGSGQKGNDYPFVIGATPYNVICVSGNIGYDGGAGAWYYNANTMTGSGDHVTVYLHASEAVVRDWVYVAWHFKRIGSSTTTTQYVKLGVTAPMEQVAQETVSELYTPSKVYLGGGPAAWEHSYMQYARLYAMSSIPSASAVNAIAMRTTPDPAAWGDWPMIDAGTSDVSGNGRNVVITGSWLPGIAGPALGATAISGNQHYGTVRSPNSFSKVRMYDLAGRLVNAPADMSATGFAPGAHLSKLYAGAGRAAGRFMTIK